MCSTGFIVQKSYRPAPPFCPMHKLASWCQRSLEEPLYVDLSLKQECVSDMDILAVLFWTVS